MLQKILTYILTLSCLTFFLSLNFTFAQGDFEGGLIIQNTRDFCSTNVICEKTEDGTYECSSDSTNLAGQNSSTQCLQSGKEFRTSTIGLKIRDTNGYQMTYSGFSNTSIANFVYPFVRIIKIQV